MWSITKEGNIIFIDLHKKIKLQYYEEHYGLFNTEEEAQKAKKYRMLVNRHLKGCEDL